jgi:hypothetical protein
LKNVDAPAEEYMQSLVKEDEKVYVDALNVYASLFPRTLAPDLFGIFFASLDDEEMDDIFIISLVIAARAIWLYGHNRPKKKLNSSKIHALHVLGNLVDVSMIANIADTNWNSDLDEETNLLLIERDIDRSIVDILLNLNGNSDLDEETNLLLIERDIDRSIVDILLNLNVYDDGTMHDYIIDTIHLIHTPELFR